MSPYTTYLVQCFAYSQDENHRPLTAIHTSLPGTTALTLVRTAGAGLLGGGGARYALEGSRGFVGVVGVGVFSSLFLFLGGGFGLLLVVVLFEGISGSSFKKGFVLLATEFESGELFESLTPSGLSGPKICKRRNICIKLNPYSVGCNSLPVFSNIVCPVHFFSRSQPEGGGRLSDKIEEGGHRTFKEFI